MKNIFWLFSFVLMVSCANQKEVTNNFVPDACVSVGRLDSDYLIRNEVNSLYISVNGIPLADLEIELTLGEVLSFNYGVCEIMVKEGDKTTLTISSKNIDHPLMIKEFKIIDKK